MKSVNLKDLPPELQKQVRGKLPKTRVAKFSAEQTRRHAIKVLAAVAELEQDQRRRVLQHALKLNQV